MRNGIVGIGIDLTQHVPLVSVASCPEAVRADREVDVATLARHWPPRLELVGQFRQCVPTCLLPVMYGEPALVGDAAAQHRRCAGLPWPPEAQVPFALDPECGIGRVPLVAAWTALVPSPDGSDAMSRRDDFEFRWRPSGRELGTPASHLLAQSIRSCLRTADVPVGSVRTAVVVPDALDESGQQLLLDALASEGLASGQIHLLPRPMAAAINWCCAMGKPPGGATHEEQGEATGVLRILGLGLDTWEAVSVEIRALHCHGRDWLLPVRNRSPSPETAPELHQFGVQLAMALASAEAPPGVPLGWWNRLFASDWLARRLRATAPPSAAEAHAINEVRATSSPTGPEEEMARFPSLEPLCRRLHQRGPPLRQAVPTRWAQQESRAGGATAMPCSAILVHGCMAGLRWGNGQVLGQVYLPAGAAKVILPGDMASFAASGAALAATAIAAGLPCYRETLLPLELYVLGHDQYGDPKPFWSDLVAADSVEAGRPWRSPRPVTGFKITAGEDRIVVPLRRNVGGRLLWRKVSTDLVNRAKKDEPVTLVTEVLPGQGFARVRIESVTPGVLSTRLDWRSMKECDPPAPPTLAYVPGVSRVMPDRELFAQARPLMLDVVAALDRPRASPVEPLRELIRVLNRWPLAHNVERARGRSIAKDPMLHYGVIGSSGELGQLPDPDLVQALRGRIGRRFAAIVQTGRGLGESGKVLLRAAGWLYLAMPDECYEYVRSRMRSAGRRGPLLSAEELNAVGLAVEAPEDLKLFYPLVVSALRDTDTRPNNWLRAVRNICRFRNHALRPDAVSERVLSDLVDVLLGAIRRHDDGSRLGKIPCNCLEVLPFLLKRRRYESGFLDASSPLAAGLIRYLSDLHRESAWRLPRRLQTWPALTLRFIRREATEGDVEGLLAVEDEDDE